jgi:hypothetical protein
LTAEGSTGGGKINMAICDRGINAMLPSSKRMVWKICVVFQGGRDLYGKRDGDVHDCARDKHLGNGVNTFHPGHWRVFFFKLRVVIAKK